MQTADPTEYLLRESIKEAKRKLEEPKVLVLNQSSSEHFNSANTFVSPRQPFQASVVANSHQLQLAQEKVKQLTIDNQALRASNRTMANKLHNTEMQLQNLRQMVTSLDSQLKVSKQESSRTIGGLEDIIEDLKKQIDLNKKITTKYKSDLQKTVQNVTEKENQYRQLTNEYNILLNAKNNKENQEDEELRRCEKRITNLIKENTQLKTLIMKNKHRQTDENTNTNGDNKEEQLMNQNLRLLKKLKELKLQNEALRNENSDLQKNNNLLRKNEESLGNRLERLELNKRVILQEAAKNGVAISHKNMFTDEKHSKAKSINRSRSESRFKSSSKKTSTTDSLVSKPSNK